MKLELKKIKLGPGSEETTQFTAELFVNGKLAAYCDNDGKGGSTDIRAYKPEHRALVAEAEAYCKTLPPLSLGGGTAIPMNLEHWVDEEVFKAESAKELQKTIKKLDRLCERNVVLVSRQQMEDFRGGRTNQLSYRTMKFHHPISRYSAESKIKIVQQSSTNLKGDEYIYNENLPKI